MRVARMGPAARRLAPRSRPALPHNTTAAAPTAHLQRALNGEGVDAHEALPAGLLHVVGCAGQRLAAAVAVALQVVTLAVGQGHLNHIGGDVDGANQVACGLREAGNKGQQGVGGYPG